MSVPTAEATWQATAIDSGQPGTDFAQAEVGRAALVRSSTAGSRLHPRGNKAVIGSLGDVLAGMIAVKSEAVGRAVWPLLTLYSRWDCLLHDGSNC